MRVSKTVVAASVTMVLGVSIGAVDEAAAGGFCGSPGGFSGHPYAGMSNPWGYRYGYAPRAYPMPTPMAPNPWMAWGAHQPRVVKTATMEAADARASKGNDAAVGSSEGMQASAAEPPTETATGDANVAEAKGLIKEFATALKGELTGAIKAGGPKNAVEVCNLKAPQIATDVAASSGWEVGRTSLKLRNPETNTPDQWEREVLAQFEERKASGEPVESIAYSETVEADGNRTFRFMKAIPTAEVCLACHGSDITPEVAAEIDRYYPNDQARGYEVGDIRGAFTLSKPM